MPACHAGDRRFESGRVRHPLSIPRTPRPPARTGRSFPRFSARGYSAAVSVRDPGFDPRRRHPRSGAHPASAVCGGGSRASGLAPARARRRSCWSSSSASGSAVACWAARPRRPPRHPARWARRRARRIPAPRPLPRHRRTGAASGDPGAEPSPTAAVVAADPVLADVAIVPVTQFRTGRARRRAADVKGIAAGTSPYSALVLVERDADAILAALGVKRVVPRHAPRHVPVREGAVRRTSRSTAPASGSCARTRSPPPSGRSPGAPTRCSASGASRRSPTGR